MTAANLEIVPLNFAAACDFVAAVHRHHTPPRGCKFSLGVRQSGNLVGVAIVGRPVSRMLDDGRTAEVTRLCTDGTPNACSALYGAAARAAKAMGFVRIITYTLESEPGTSLKASGWLAEGKTDGGSWSRGPRARLDKHPTCPKTRWSRQLGKAESQGVFG